MDVDEDDESVRFTNLKVIHGQLHRVVPLIDEGDVVVRCALPGAGGCILLALLVVIGPIRHPVAVEVPVVVPALEVPLVLLALVEHLVVPVLLPLDPVVGQVERRGRLVAWSSVLEVIVVHITWVVIPGSIPIEHVEVEVEAQSAGVVVSLQEPIAKYPCGSGGIEQHFRGLGVSSMLCVVINVPSQPVAFAHFQVLDGELHGVVAVTDEWVLRPSMALPCSIRLLFAIVPVVGPVRLPVAVVVPVVHPALVVLVAIFEHLLAPVEVVEVLDLLVLHAVHGQGEWRGWYLAGPIELELG